MTRNNDDHSDGEEGLLPGYDDNPMGKNQRREPIFSSFDKDDEDEYEEPDRDTDYSSGFSADSVDEEEEFEDQFPDEEDNDLVLEEEDDDPDYPPSSGWREPEQSVAEEPDDWLQNEEYLEEEDDSGQKWPLGLIAVAIVALALLIGGGYGVMQQRAATEEELRQLRATLATSTKHADEGANREVLQELKKSYDELAATAQALALENRRLADTVAGLQAQQGAQQAVLTKSVPAASQVNPATAAAAMPPQPVAPRPVTPASAEPKPVAPKPVAAVPQAAPPKTPPAPSPAATSSGPWFVNFGSYASRSVAESWASKLRPGTGKVVIAPSAKDGQTLYRLRVVGLDSRGSAQEVARKLETELRVSALWVGKE
jgi:cell division protein FtsN